MTEGRVVVTLAATPNAARFFATDLCAMLAAKGARGGDSLDAFVLASQQASQAVWTASLHSTPSDVLDREVGRHRAQYVPAGSGDGRVETVVADVRIEFKQSIRATDDLVRTYNYPLRLYTEHRTAASGSLDDALAGRTD